MHFPVEAVADHAIARGVEMPERIVSIAPNVAKPSSRGRVWITSSDPAERPRSTTGISPMLTGMTRRS